MHTIPEKPMAVIDLLLGRRNQQRALNASRESVWWEQLRLTFLYTLR